MGLKKLLIILGLFFICTSELSIGSPIDKNEIKERKADFSTNLNSWVLDEPDLGVIDIRGLFPYRAVYYGALKISEEVFSIQVCSSYKNLVILEGFHDSYEEFIWNRPSSCVSLTPLESKNILVDKKPVNFTIFYDGELLGKYSVSLDLESESYLTFHKRVKNIVKEEVWNNNIEVITKQLFILLILGIFIFIGFKILKKITKKLYMKARSIKNKVSAELHTKNTNKIIERTVVEESVKSKLKKSDLNERKYLEEMILNAVKEGDYKKVERLTIILNELEK